MIVLIKSGFVKSLYQVSWQLGLKNKMEVEWCGQGVQIKRK